MSNKKWEIRLPLLIALAMVAGMSLGYKLTQGTGKGLFGSNKRNALQEALDLIRYRYVDPVNIDTLQQNAITEMMNGLDPHSILLAPSDLQEANEELAGNFEGIGVEFNVFSDTVTITYVIPEGPSYKAGLLPGDKILKAGDSSLLEKNISTEKIKSLIKGPSNSSVVLSLIRKGKPLQVNVKRGVIPMPSLEAAYMLDSNTGYMKLTRFAETTYEEFMKELESMQNSGMQNLVLDLRENGGGLLSEAVDIADELLGGDKLIVYTEGTHSSRKEFRCERPGLFEKGKLVLLVDELSASASEVLSGAIQDWCRGTIIGRTTFGKGLVQEQYMLKDGSALRLTVARYYTPLGRCIQRSYENGKKLYLEEGWERYQQGNAAATDSLLPHKGKKFLTTCGDTLYEGGGITPNIFIPRQKEDSLPHATMLLASVTAYSDYAFQFYLQNQERLNQFSSAINMMSNLSLQQDIWNGWLHKTQKDSLDYRIATTTEKKMVLERLMALIARYKWRYDGYYQVLNNDDACIKKAMEQIK